MLVLFLKRIFIIPFLCNELHNFTCLSMLNWSNNRTTTCKFLPSISDDSVPIGYNTRMMNIEKWFSKARALKSLQISRRALHAIFRNQIATEWKLSPHNKSSTNIHCQRRANAGKNIVLIYHSVTSRKQTCVKRFQYLCNLHGPIEKAHYLLASSIPRFKLDSSEMRYFG